MASESFQVDHLLALGCQVVQHRCFSRPGQTAQNHHSQWLTELLMGRSPIGLVTAFEHFGVKTYGCQ